MADKKHAELIRAWLDGSDIQVLIRFINKDEWRDCDSPTWAADKVFRIKPTPPAKQYPVTAMTHAEISDAYGHLMCGTGLSISPDAVKRLEAFANIVLKHGIDYSTIVAPDAYQQCAADLLKAEETIRTLTEVLRAHNPEQRRERDRAIAKAVAAEYSRCVGQWQHPYWRDGDLDAIIATVGK